MKDIPCLVVKRDGVGVIMCILCVMISFFYFTLCLVLHYTSLAAQCYMSVIDD